MIPYAIMLMVGISILINLYFITPLLRYLWDFSWVLCMRIGESELQGFRGVLQSMNSWQRHTTYSESTLKTSELALIHREILSR